MKQNWTEQIKAAAGRTQPKALKAPSESYPSEDTNMRGYLHSCYHLDRQIRCLHQQSPVQPKHTKFELKYMHTPPHTQNKRSVIWISLVMAIIW